MRYVFLLSLLLGLDFPGLLQAQQPTSLTGLESANDARAWRAVGRLDAHGTGFCTATLIAPDLILTATHCVYNPQSGQRVKAAGLTFRAGLRQGTVVAERKIARIEVHPAYDPTTGNAATNIRFDVALLRLAVPIPTHIIDPFVVQDRAMTTGPVSVVSYGQGRMEVPSRQKVCHILDEVQQVVVMDCDITFGSSGAPVFSQAGGYVRIVSVISSMSALEGQHLAYGMTLAPRIAELKQQMSSTGQTPVAAARRIRVHNGQGARQPPSGAKFVRPDGS